MDEEVRAYQRKLQQGEGDLAYYLHLLERSGQAGPFLANNLPAYHANAVRHHLLTKTTVDASPFSDARSPVLAAITWLLSQKLATRALIVCPASCISSWEERLRVREVKFITVRGKNAHVLTSAPGWPSFDVYLTSYEILSRMAAHMGNASWAIIVCDEAHYIKNIATVRHHAVASVATSCKAQWRIAITGCPVTRSLLDIYGIYRFVDPTILPKSIWEFRTRFMRPTQANYKYSSWEPTPTAFAEIMALIDKTMWRSGE